MMILKSLISLCKNSRRSYQLNVTIQLIGKIDLHSFILSKKDFDKALLYFNNGIKKYPEAEQQAQMNSGLASAFYEQSQKEETLLYVQKSI
jgi:hypothetical protein